MIQPSVLEVPRCDRRLSALVCAVLLVAGLIHPAAWADDARELEPQTHMVPMKDGIRLATDVYLPPGAEPPFPTILARSPYGRGQGEGVARRFCDRGYAFVLQDLRGRFGSEGDDVVIFGNDGWREHTDGHDTLAWIAAQPWSDGKVATWGGSALGVTQNMLAPGASDHLQAQHVEVAFSDMYGQGTYQGGVWRKALIETWLAATGMTEGNQEIFLSHPAYDDFWRSLNPESRAADVNAPGVFIGGWYDIFLQGSINSFVTINGQGGPAARDHCRLVVGPWAHGGFDELTYPDNSKHSRMPAAGDALRFFDHHLRGQANGVADDKAVHYYVMGDPTVDDAPGNEWRSADSWPPPAVATPWYFHADGTLAAGDPPAGDESATFTYDPANPVPTIGGQNLALPKGPMDQRKAESRDDVLVFTSDVLAEPVEVTGPVTARLYVSSDCPDTDFTVKLTDVYPDGRSMLVTDGIQRARFRNSSSEPEWLEPGQVYAIDVDLWSTSLIFNRGHQIRVVVSSSNSPRFETNPNTGPDVEAAPRPAENTVHLSRDHASQIVLPIYGG
ncbi:MAG: CocE/NonD family hydrolase [Planctomycetales bacterium]|nr:CocE/NonD family hydrolase [Planctomycetales bacterium]